MLLKLTGSSCSTTLAHAVAARLGHDIAVHDFDEIGVPCDAGKVWRHQANEVWIRRALEYQALGLDLLLTGQSPLGEVLATPSAPELNGISVCLVDVEDNIRLERLRRRDGHKWSSGQEQAFLNWSAWHRGHAADPQHQPEVVTGW